MTITVAELLTTFETTSWFSNCGVRLEGDYVFVRSLEEAQSHYADKAGVRWENFKNSVFNRHRRAVWDATQSCRQEQQEKAKEATEAIQQFFRLNNLKLFSALSEDSELKRMLQLDFGWIASEVAFASYDTVRFFSNLLLPVYLAGHLPCGWRGKAIKWNWDGSSLADLPEGKLVVF